MLLVVATASAALAGGAATSAAASAAAGLALASRGQLGEAVVQLEHSLSIDGDQPDTMVNLGVVWEQLDLPMNALECYAQAIAIAPECAAAYTRMGQALENHMNDREAALQAVQAAVAIDPLRGDSWNLIGQLQHSRGELDEAQDALARAVELRPDDDAARRNLATVLRAVGRFDEAAEELRVVAARCADDAFVDQALAFAPAGLDGDSESRAAAAAATDESSRPSSASERASVGASALPESTPTEWRDPLRRVFLTPGVATAEECEWAIEAAEAHAAERGGWDGQGHHDTHRTNDIVAAACPELRQWLKAKLASSIWPALGAQFGISAADLWLEDCFVVKYEASGQPGLGAHADDSELSFNVLLSDPSDFEGGGTAFPDAEDAESEGGVTLRPARGEMVSHYGGLQHAGRPVSDGTRYIIAGFVRARPLAERWRELRRDT